MSSLPPPGNIFGGITENKPIPRPSGTPKKASLLPLIVAIVCIIASVIISLLIGSTDQNISMYLIGYFLTPLLVGLCMGWDSIDQRKKTKSDPWFIPKSKYSLLLRIITGMSFLVALPHINSIARILSTLIAER